MQTIEIAMNRRQLRLHHHLRHRRPRYQALRLLDPIPFWSTTS